LEWLEWTAKPGREKNKIPVDKGAGVSYFATAGRAVKRQKTAGCPLDFRQKKMRGTGFYVVLCVCVGLD
jgi:hypothetical protein